MSAHTLTRHVGLLRNIVRSHYCNGRNGFRAGAFSSTSTAAGLRGTSEIHQPEERVKLNRVQTYPNENASRPYSSTKHREGIFSRIFGDQKDEGGSAGAQAERSSMRSRIKSRITGRKKIKNCLTDKTEEQASEDWEIKDDGIFEHVPTKDMTGVEPIMTQLCSTISAQLYSKKQQDEFKLSTKDIQTEVFIYDNHGEFLETSPPFLVAIAGTTMILGWRGTNSLADGLNDAACSPQSSLAWRKHVKTIRAQGAMTSIVHNDIANHEEAIIQKAKESGITEIITTGQSLGGGCAQVGHLTLRALIEDERSPWSELEGVNVRSIAFCAPMTTVLTDHATSETDAFVEKLWDNSVNFVYKNDVVPRAYGYLSFIEDFVDDITENLTSEVPVPRVLKRICDFQGKLDELVDSAQDNKSVDGLLSVLSNYRHIGSVIYYESEDAHPLVLKDMGAFYKNTTGESDIFRSVKYKSVKKPLDEFMKWHMDIIRAPGLSFPNSDLK